MKRALPGRMVDLIHDGTRPADLRRQGDRAVWNALVSTATSAWQRDWTYAQWAGLISEPASNLGRQARIKKGRSARTSRDYEKLLTDVWNSAAKWAANAPDAVEIEIEIRDRIRTARDLAADSGADLTDNERLVLEHAAHVAERNHTDRPAMPSRATADALNLTERAVRTALANLNRKKVLALAVRGRAAGSQKYRRASLYRLPAPDAFASPIPVPGNPVYTPLAQVYTPPTGSASASPEQVYASPEGESVVTLTLSGGPETLAQIVAALAARRDVRVSEGDSRPAEQAAARGPSRIRMDNVRPLRRTARADAS